MNVVLLELNRKTIGRTGRQDDTAATNRKGSHYSDPPRRRTHLVCRSLLLLHLICKELS
jgi:hypothetical protein